MSYQTPSDPFSLAYTTITVGPDTLTVIDFMGFSTNPYIELFFNGIGINHYLVYFRSNAYHDCTSPTKIGMFIDGVEVNSNANNVPSSFFYSL
jgi:hypothetical protein